MERIAIIGIGCRFPGGIEGPSGYWTALAGGRCAIGEIPPDRWSLAGFHDARADLPDRSYSKWGGFLGDIRGFDAAWFGLSRREAEAMDPQQRLLLEVACEAAFDARLPLSALRGERAGVFIGVSNVDYGLLQRHRAGYGDIQAGTGTALSIVANRVSNRLDLSGPSMGIDTACSSSLVALDTACRHLADRSCGMALAGGVNILLDPRMFVTFSRAHMLSPTGRIRAFDAAADGFVRGEGVGVVVLRRLDDALAAGDRIYAVIEATAVNQDGRTGAITEPSRAAQIAMIEDAVARAGIAVHDIAYVEAHGTGTPVGDPIEVNAIGHVLGGHARRAPLLIGSVKTNIGHLEPAAGIAGLIKAALVLHRRAIPPSLGFERPNPAIAFDALNIEVASTSRPLPPGPAHALVNSFGFGGTNACAVLSGVGWVKRSAPQQFPAHRGSGVAPGSRYCASGVGPDYGNCPLPIPLSAPTARHLAALAATLAQEIEHGCLAHLAVNEIAAALATQRDQHPHRAVVVAGTTAELRERLLCLAEGREWPKPERHSPPQIIFGTAKPGRKLCFTMTGQGGQWWAMGRELIACEPVFREAIERFDRVFAPVGGWSVMDALLADEATSRIDDAAITPAVMFAFQTGLAEVWQARGITPDLVLGHSFGEVTAAYLAGGLAVGEIAGLVNQRGLIRHRVDRVGAMAAIGLGAAEVEPMLPSDGSIEIGGYNAPGMVTLTGEAAAIDALIARLNAEDASILTRKLALDFAYHSSWFAPVEQRFMDEVGALTTKPPRLPVVSTVTGALNDRFDATYWWRNLRHPVRYHQAVDTALDMGADVFVELGPHRTLSSMTAACAAARGREVVTVTTLDRRWGDLVSLAVATGQLWTAGVEVDWTQLLAGDGRSIELPCQPWLREPLWLEPEEARRQWRPATVHPLLGRAEPGPGHAWRADVALATHDWLGDHRLDGTCVFPAAGYLEMMVAAARIMLAGPMLELVDVSFPSALFIDDDDEVQLATAYDEARSRIEIFSRVRDGATDWELRAAAGVFAGDARAAMPVDTSLDGAVQVDRAAFYRQAMAAGYGWGRQFQCLATIEQSPGAALGLLQLPADAHDLTGLVLDPRLLDAGLQLMLASGREGEMLGVMPTGIGRVIVSGDLTRDARALGRTRPLDSQGGVEASIDIADVDGRSLVRISGLVARRRGRPSTVGQVSDKPRLLHEVFEPLPRLDVPGDARGWIVLARTGCGRTGRLVGALRTSGCDVDVCVMPSEPAATADFFAAQLDRALTQQPARGVVFALPLAVARDRAEAAADIAGRLARDVIMLGRALERRAAEQTVPPLVIMTCRARSTHDGEAIDAAGLAQSPVLAAGRTIAMEVPSLDVRLIDLDDAALDDKAVLRVALATDPAETEIAVRAGQVFAARLIDLDEAAAAKVERAGHTLSALANYALRHAGSPGPDGLSWSAAPTPALRGDEVLIEVAAVGLNFRDVMAVSGLLPVAAEADSAVDALGLEFAGRVVAVGAGVADLAPGERVLGMGRGVLQRYIVRPAATVRRVPADLSDSSAATIPSAYLTAHYALNEIGRMRAGETVLIHSATGGVGLAAIALARRVGASIIATAGTEEKRMHLNSLGIEHVFDSRSLAFADGVLAATGGRGVDIVLNALGGAFIAKGLACLAPYGRFLELGKRDVYADAALGMKALRANASFHVIDLAAMIEERPPLAARLLDDVLAMLAAGEIAPLPATVFSGAAVGEAFRQFAAARHIGKIVVDVGNRDIAVRGGLASGATLDAGGTYLVTGGGRGFGLAVARWLAARGAGQVVVASRSAAIACSDQAIEQVQLDVTSRPDVERVVAMLCRRAKPLRGIVHAAVVYDDARLSGMTADRIERVLAPKITGALNLTHAAEQAGARLDFFVTFSSLAQVVGWPGQSNYAAANGFLEALAVWQRARGVRGHCINWGALGESGHVADRPEMQAYLSASGWIGMSDADALAALARALDLDVPVVTIAAADWPRLGAAHRPFARARRFSGMVADAARSSAGAGLAGLEGRDLEAAALALVRAEVARVLRAPTCDLAPDATLAEAGIDSLSSFELHSRIEQRVGFAVPMPRYAKARRLGELGGLLAALVREAAGPE